MGTTLLITLVLYFALLMLISYFTTRKGVKERTYYDGDKKSPWYIVAFGMIGSTISGVTFVSVPGMIGEQDMTYMQMVLGFFFGYVFIAYVLLPLYYRLKLITIYGYLNQRFGNNAYKSGASFFILSKTIGAAARLYLVILILHTLVFSQWNIPFFVVALVSIILIWIYTFKGGIKTIVWTDTLQTFCLLLALGFIIWQVVAKLGFNWAETTQMITHSEHFRMFDFGDWVTKQNFWKQFLSGVLIAIVMNGLDQDMMQKSLSCKNIKDAQKNMMTFGFLYVPINFLFLCLGILLLIFASQFNISLPEKADEIMPTIVTEYLGLPAIIFFSIGIVAAAFSSIDSAIAALTTTVCVDLLGIEKKKEGDKKNIRVRYLVQGLISILILIVVMVIYSSSQTSIINTIYKIASYTYGPLLGLFFFGLFTKINIRDKFVPIVCILAPVLSFCMEIFLKKSFDYSVGNEILLFNGLLTVVGLLILMKPAERK